MTNPTEEPEDAVNTRFHNVALGRVGWPEELASTARFVASDESSYCTGSELVADGGGTCGDITPMLPGAPDFTSR